MTPALSLRGLHKKFGATDIIRGIDLDIVAGERHALIGPNGAGKSTLFNLITGRLSPDTGRILLKGRDITARSPFDIHRQGLARSFQITNIFSRMSVYENLRTAVLWSAGYGYSFWHGIDGLLDVSARVEAVLTQIRLDRRRDVSASELTYAEQRSLEIGLAIAGACDTILLDEPTAGMSRSEASHVVALIREVTRGKTLLMVEHDMSVVFDLADRISVLVYGRIVATDVPDRIRADAGVREAYLGTEAA
jgi:branched-chain amino acid transport system ATP-binding protein